MLKITNKEMVWSFELMFDKFNVDKNTAYVMRLSQTDFMAIMIVMMLIVMVVVEVVMLKQT